MLCELRKRHAIVRPLPSRCARSWQLRALPASPPPPRDHAAPPFGRPAGPRHDGARDVRDGAPGAPRSLPASSWRRLVACRGGAAHQGIELVRVDVAQVSALEDRDQSLFACLFVHACLPRGNLRECLRRFDQRRHAHKSNHRMSRLNENTSPAPALWRSTAAQEICSITDRTPPFCTSTSGRRSG